MKLRKTNWTEEEKNYLAEHYGEMSIKSLARNLSRSENAINVMRYKLRLGRFLENGDYVTLNQLHEAIYGRSLNTYINGTWKRNGLNIMKRRVNNKNFQVVMLDEFWKWAEQHKGLVSFRLFERYALGAEPAWVEAKRTHDYYKRPHNDPWTKQEDEKLKEMLGKKTYPEISAALHRSNAAVKRRIYDLGLQGSPIRAKNKAWSDKEKAELLKLYQAGINLDDIGAKLGRTGGAVRAMYERIINPHYQTEYKRRIRQADNCLEQTSWTPAGRHGYSQAK